MSREKLRIAQTEADNLLANLRGEVGEVITSWMLMRGVLAQARALTSGDEYADLRNQDLAVLRMVADRLEDDVVGRLSELGEYQVGRLNFHFAARKFQVLQDEAKRFTTYVSKAKMRDRRNQAISHKELP